MTSSVPEALHHLADRDGPRLAVFDADGVLWHGDVSEDFTLWMIERGHFDGALWPGYLATNERDPARGCLDILGFYTGIEIERLRAFVEEFWHAGPARRWIESTVSTIAWLGDHGFEIFIVSGTPRVIFDPLPRHLHVDATHILALELEMDGHGRATGRHAGVPTVGDGKARRIRAATVDPVSLAVGDSALDIEMLELSEDIKWVVGTEDVALRALAEREGWLITETVEE